MASHFQIWEHKRDKKNFWVRWQYFWDRHWKLRNLGRSLAAFFDHEFVWRGHWHSVCLRGVWYRENPKGVGWCLIWWGEGLLDFKRVRIEGVEPPAFRTVGPIDLIPEWSFGPVRFYRLEALREDA